MSDVNGAAAPAETANIPVAVAGGDGPITARDAARSVSDWRHKLNAQMRNSTAAREPAVQQANGAAPAAEPATPAPAGNESDAVQAADDAAPVETPAPGETQAADPATEPPIELPRSWTREQSERWQSLPRETQAYLAEREQERDREIRRVQNEAAEARKATEAERTQAAKARQDYEGALPVLLQQLVAAPEWADIKTQADVDVLARTDPARWVQWSAHKEKVTAVAQELRAAQERQANENSTRFSDWSSRQDELFAEKAPEMANKEHADKMRSRAVEVLKEIGFGDDELTRMWHGQQPLSLRDARIQALVLDGVRFRDAKAKASAAPPKPVPPVQRPGVAPAKNAAEVAQVQAAAKKLENATGISAARAAADLMAARRRAASR